MKSVYCAVWTGSLNKAVSHSFLKDQYAYEYEALSLTEKRIALYNKFHSYCQLIEEKLAE